jgi:hypothetical protein
MAGREIKGLFGNAGWVRWVHPVISVKDSGSLALRVLHAFDKAGQ